MEPPPLLVGLRLINIDLHFSPSLLLLSLFEPMDWLHFPKSQLLYLHILQLGHTLEISYLSIQLVDQITSFSCLFHQELILGLTILKQKFLFDKGVL